MADVLSVGIVAAGTIARSHMNAIDGLDNVRVAAVMDVDGERAETEAKAHGARAYTDLASLLKDPEVEAVHVCSPHNMHGEQVVAAAEAGKHVLVEKPMALTLDECDRMIAACEAAGKVLMVGQVMRHFPVNLKVKALIAEGAVGKVGHMMRRRYSYFNTARPGSTYGAWYMDVNVGGICALYCFGPHEYDILPWYMDSPVVEIYARGTGGSALYKGQNDSYTAVMTHENGAVSVLSQSVVCHASAHDHYIIGSEGSMMMTNQKLVMNGEEVPVEGSTGDGMPNQIREFATCCLEGGTPDASGRSVRHTMAVIEAAKQSAERKETMQVSEFE